MIQKRICARAGLGGAALLLACFALIQPVSADVTRLEEKRTELRKLEAAAKELARQLAQIRSKSEQARQAIFELEAGIAELRKRYRTNQDVLATQRARLQELTRERARLQERISFQQQRLAVHLRAANRLGQYNYLRQLFGHIDPTRVQRALTYLSYLHRARKHQLERLTKARHQLQAVVSELQERRHKAKRLKQAIEKQRRELKSRLKRRKALLTKLHKRQREEKERLAAIRSDRAALRTVIHRLQQQYERLPAKIRTRHISALKGELPPPVESPHLLARFGASRHQQGLKWHGVVLGAPPGTKVKAIYRGRIVYAGPLRGYGLLTIIDHGEGLLSLYGHNRALFKSVGDWVEAGEVIAAVGSTGGHSRPGSYFAIRRNGQPVDPLHWCALPGSS